MQSRLPALKDKLRSPAPPDLAPLPRKHNKFRGKKFVK